MLIGDQTHRRTVVGWLAAGWLDIWQDRMPTFAPLTPRLRGWGFLHILIFMISDVVTYDGREAWESSRGTSDQRS